MDKPENYYTKGVILVMIIIAGYFAINHFM